jgi:hypothetical protein
MRHPVKAQRRLLVEQRQEVRRRRNKESNEKRRGWKLRTSEKAERIEGEQKVSSLVFSFGSN